jgi:hypothetical protein
LAAKVIVEKEKWFIYSSGVSLNPTLLHPLVPDWGIDQYGTFGKRTIEVLGAKCVPVPICPSQMLPRYPGIETGLCNETALTNHITYGMTKLA